MRVRKATLSDVARQAGVSATTASYIINGRSTQMRISPETERRVRQAVVDLGYRPNRSARSLRTATTGMIGVITDFVASGQFASQMLSGASAAARRADHLLVMGESEGDRRLESLLIEEMLDRQVDGIVYVTRTHQRVSVPPVLLRHRTVLLNCTDPTTDLPTVLPDEQGGGRAAVGGLLAAGVRGDIWVVGEDPTPNALAGPDRLAGMRERLAEDGRSLAGVIACPWSVGAAYDAVLAWLDAGGTAAGLVCLNDRVAMGTYQALADRGLRVAHDVAVVSFDGSELATWLRPPVDSVSLPFTALGERAVETLMDPRWRTLGTVRLPMTLVPGGTVRGTRVAPG
jgi:LacI family transcriptional regulator